MVVIAGLIAGSYMISYRIHKQMSENSQVDFGQSTLQNIQSQNDSLKTSNAALSASNELLTETTVNDEQLINGAGDLMEQDDCLTAAFNAYVNEEYDLATQLFYAIDAEKLSSSKLQYYENLADKLGIDLTAEEETPEKETSEEETPEEETSEVQETVQTVETAPAAEVTETEEEEVFFVEEDTDEAGE